MRYCLGLILGLVFGQLAAQEKFTTQIDAVADFAKNEAIVLKTYTDFFTCNTKILDTLKVDSAGRLFCRFKIFEPAPILIHFKNTATEFIAEPGKSYRFEWSLDSNYELFLNPADYGIFIQMKPLPFDSSDLNFKIRQLEYAVEKMTAHHWRTLYENKSVEIYDSLIADLKFRYRIDFTKEDFYNIYAFYHLGQLDLMMFSAETDKLFQKYFNREIVHYHNPAYMALFNAFYDGYVKRSPFISKKVLKEVINQKPNLLDLFNELGKDPNLVHERLREMALLQTLAAIWTDSDYSQKNIAELIKNLALTSKFTEHRTMAAEILKNLSKTQVNEELKSFVAETKTGQRVHLSDKRGKYIYLQFYNMNCDDCIREMLIVKSLHEKYKDSVDFITISLDANKTVFRKFTETYPQFNWEFWNFNQNYAFLESLNINSLPHCVLLDKNGNLLQNYAPEPGRNLTETLQELFPEPEKQENEDIRSRSKRR